MLRNIFLKENILKFLNKSYILIVLAIIYIPLLFVIFLSFTGKSAKGNVVYNFESLTFTNWNELFKNNDFVNSLLNSIYVALLVTPISVLIGIGTCFGMWNAKNKTKKIIKSFSTINISIPDIITGISLVILFTSIWLPLGLDFGYSTTILSHISFTTPYAIIAIWPKMMTLKKSLIDASNDLGARKIRTFFRVVLPHIYPSIIAACVIVIATSFDDFVITLLTSGNFRTISSVIYLSAKGIKAWIVTFGAILIVLFILGSFLLALFKITKNKKNILEVKK